MVTGEDKNGQLASEMPGRFKLSVKAEGAKLCFLT
jgi:hypothetical protein